MSIVRVLLAALVLMIIEEAFAFDGECFLKVRGKIYLNGICNIEIDPDGSFTVGVGELKRSKYFSYVIIERPGVASGSWNGRSAESHAHESLGILMRSGSCWKNETAKICAKKLSN
jgi:hypothetical protein